MPRNPSEYCAPAAPACAAPGGDNGNRGAIPKPEKPLHLHITLAWRKRIMRQREIYA